MFCSSASKIAGSLYSEPWTRSGRIRSSHCDGRGMTFIAASPMTKEKPPPPSRRPAAAQTKNNPADRSNNNTRFSNLQGHLRAEATSFTDENRDRPVLSMPSGAGDSGAIRPNDRFAMRRRSIEDTCGIQPFAFCGNQKADDCKLPDV